MIRIITSCDCRLSSLEATARNMQDGSPVDIERWIVVGTEPVESSIPRYLHKADHTTPHNSQVNEGEALVKDYLNMCSKVGECDMICALVMEPAILRIQRMIREGKLNAKEVKFLYMTHENEPLRVLRVDADGDFIDEWPHGFFEAPFRELFHD